MPSYHHSGERKNGGKGGDVKRIRGENKKRSSRNTGRVTRNTNSNPRDRKLLNQSQNSRYRKEKSTKMYRKDCSARSSLRNSPSSSSPMRSPWATPQKLQNKPAWSRSPERPEGFYRQSSDTPYESQSRENHESGNSNRCCDHNEDEYEPYVYEKIDGWDTDTDDEETTKTE
ncbi:hypothetical protein CAEBREN_00620 [Caenorhabditis brenneri]|uniref:Uncharacterized protein n=1 Tax=Caenorhabditis brenneri TaxID=135651 RepID=G0P0D2_CAEBE|nr:hypothetical protein CAEBREN_00620 [Caenorhabditis brenneri]